MIWIIKSPVLLVAHPAGAFFFCEKPGVAGWTPRRGFFGVEIGYSNQWNQWKPMKPMKTNETNETNENQWKPMKPMKPMAE